MKIQELIDKLSEIRDTNPEKDVVIEVFDIRQSRVDKGYMFELAIQNDKDLIRIRQTKLRGYCLYAERTEDMEEIEAGLCPEKKSDLGEGGK